MRRNRRRRAFSLIELLVVIGIIAILIGLLLPVLSSMRRSAKGVQCMAQLRDLGHLLQIYQNENDGALYPSFWNEFVQQQYPTGGTNVPPHLRWPMVVCKPKGAPMPPAYDSDAYEQGNYQPDVFPAAPYTPKNLICPADVDPFEAHSYVLNGHLCAHGIRAGKHNFGGLTTSEVIYAGEKVTFERDYFMQNRDFDRVVAKYRHGATRGSNFLHLDCHVGTIIPREALTGIDPWDLRTPIVTRP